MRFIYVIFLFTFSVIIAQAETGYKMWLRYSSIQNEEIKSEYKTFSSNIFIQQNNELLSSIRDELTTALTGMLNIKPEFNKPGDAGILIQKTQNQAFNEDGYQLLSDEKSLRISANTDKGLLYGTFHLLRLMQMQQSISNLNIVENPTIRLRLLNHWDNPGNTPKGRHSIERGYAGNSIFNWNELPHINSRYIDYARFLSSTGINGTVINNVNTTKNGLEGWKLLTPEYLPKLKALAAVFRKYGIRLYISVNFFSPVLISGIADADPLNPEVQKWWNHKVAEIYNEIPDFGGFLVKADSEGEPGPMKYNRSHADGANMLANALEPFGGIVFWRAFVYSSDGKLNIDRACQAYEMFTPLDGEFAGNALLQIKNGPIDFQVREPVSPLLGAMPQTGQVLELQITQEYTGHSRHVCFLVPQWKEVFNFDTYAKGAGSTVTKIINGELFAHKFSGVAGVSNFGDMQNWTGHILAQANSYGFGRLSWNPELSSDQIASEWISLTFGNNEKLIPVIKNILLTSWKTYEDYTSPLGVGLMCNGGLGDEGHFYPAPGSRTKYHKADDQGVGFDRTKSTGSGFTSQYFEPVKSIYENVNTCPDELLLFMHHVPYSHQLQSGKTVIQHIYDSHNYGVEKINDYISTWKTLQGLIDDERFSHVLEKLTNQLNYGMEWRDSINNYFFNLSGIKDARK